MTRHFIVFALLTVIPVTAFCEEPLKYDAKLKPSFYNQRDGNKYNIGLDFNADASYQLYTGKETTYKKSAFFEFKSEGLVTGDKDSNPRPIRAEFLFDGFLNLFGPEITKRGAQEDEVIIVQHGFNYGRLNSGIDIGYETDQAFDNRNLTAGITFGYVLTENAGLKALVPSLAVAYELVRVERSDLQDTLNADDKNYDRYRIAASWKVPVGNYLPEKFKPLSLHLDGRYFKDMKRNDAIKDADQDEASYGAVALQYTFDKARLFGMLSGIFLKVSDGRIPPATEKSTQIHLGLILWEGQTSTD